MAGRDDFESAKKLAREVHWGQIYGVRPYFDHLQAVVNVLARFGATRDNPQTSTIVIAAWLHDSLEDTSLTREDIEAQFGEVVADLVWRVSDESGTNRKARKLATYTKTRANEAAVIVKLADRIANTEAAIEENSPLLHMYQKEQSSFKAALLGARQNDISRKMWDHLDSLLALPE